MSLARNWTYASSAFLLIAMAAGLFLRYSFVSVPFVFNYKYLLHAHSHIILLGWVFNALCALIYNQYQVVLNTAISRTSFILFQIATIGMLISFPLQGYGLYSIIFSTLHIFISYLFIGHVLARLNKRESIANRFIALGSFYFIISTFGPFALGYIQSKGMVDSPLYNLAIYYYLHFLYNGFFILAVIGLILKSIFNEQQTNNDSDLRRSYYLIGYSTFPAFALSVFCYYSLNWIYLICIFTGIAQVVGYFLLIRFLLKLYKTCIKGISPSIRFFLITALGTLGVKFILQLASSVPILSVFICESHNLIIAYLHLVFIGVLTFGLIGLLKFNNLLVRNNRLNFVGWILMLFGFLVSELLLIYPAFTVLFGLDPLSNYHAFLFFSLIIVFVGTIFSVGKRIF